MDIDKLKSLIAQREAIDEEIKEVANGGKKESKPRVCGHCGKEGHSARSCPDKPQE